MNKTLYHNLPHKTKALEHIKGWGKELWVENNSQYCGKILSFNKGGKCSNHFHINKKESWYVLSGKFELTLMDVDLGTNNSCFLYIGDCITIDRGQPHQLLCLEEGQIAEFSTPHYDSDSYRISPGDSQQKPIEFPKELVEQYGQQIWRDNNYNKNSYEDNSYNGSEVCAACGQIEEEYKEEFRKVILEWANTHRKPDRFF